MSLTCGFGAKAGDPPSATGLTDLDSVNQEVRSINVAYPVIDAIIDVHWARKRYPEKPDDILIWPTAVAEELWHWAHQRRSAWSFLTQVRRYKETW
jgi:hypothetical protein